MRKCGFLLTYSLLYKDRIYDFVLIRENVGQGKPVFSHILCSGSEKQMSEITKNGRRKIFLIAEIIEQNSNKPLFKTLKRKLRQREFASSSISCCLCFAKYISKSLCFAFLSRAELSRFILRIAPE